MTAKQVEVAGAVDNANVTPALAAHWPDGPVRRADEELYRRIIETANEGIWVIGADLTTTFVNQKMADMLGYTVADMLGQPVSDYVAEDERPKAAAAGSRGRPAPAGQVESQLRRKDGTSLWVLVSSSPFFDGDGGYAGALAMVTDITERKQLEEQFRQAQKMEAVGRLAGGVAHDFNNLLTVIAGFSEMLLERHPPGDASREFLEGIREAGDRASALVRQLLAFSRKQILAPQVLDLNAVVSGTEKWLRRLLGEDIELNCALDPMLGQVRADPGQIEQVLLNLAVNARDAMPRGGTLTIQTANIVLDGTGGRARPGVPPGRYVLLRLCDTGCGMDPATRARIFEPFFTTKGEGQGTGLGLATVYGIVTQSGGHIVVESAPGEGTVFEIYLPWPKGMSQISRKPSEDRFSSPGGTETVLLVEDEDRVRAVLSISLRRGGYTVLEACQGVEALRICAGHPGPVHLLVSDVVMPQMGGRDLAERLKPLYPGLKVLLISGHTDDALVRDGVLTARTEFLQKPFTPQALAQKVRNVLDR
jgi:PAS domain S-box-containing protein